MRSASLFDCFERHLLNLDILSEGNDLFVAKVVEDYILNLSGMGFTMGAQAEDIYEEIQGEVIIMMQKKIYGFYNVDVYREHLREFNLTVDGDSTITASAENENGSFVELPSITSDDSSEPDAA